MLLLMTAVLCVACCASLRSEDGPRYRHVYNSGTVNGQSLDWAIGIPYSYEKETPAPLILSLHFGGTPTDHYGATFTNLLVLPALHEVGAIILSPTCPVDLDWRSEIMEGAILALIDSVRTQYSIDDDRILVTGFSFGGIGTWYYAGMHPEIFSAAIPIASRVTEDFLVNIDDIPIYVIHSTADEVLPSSEIVERVDTLKMRGADITLLLINGVSHYETGAFVNPLKNSIAWLREHWSHNP
ncbi:prolyl oligopeptidase family serine peptidase [Candidatus Zixiibacteriota bacterium]